MSDIDIMKEYLLMKFREGDMHAVMDAAADIRVMEARDEQREKTESKRIERSLAEISDLARASKEFGGQSDPSHLVAGRRIKADFGGELGTAPGEVDWGAIGKGQATKSELRYHVTCQCPVCTNARTKDFLQSARKDLPSLQEWNDRLKGIPTHADLQQTDDGSGKKDL